jgi:hypothetical protein
MSQFSNASQFILIFYCKSIDKESIGIAYKSYQALGIKKRKE